MLRMITIGIPTYNEEKSISKCIGSILPQLSKKDEMIIVASGCTDNTETVVKNLAKKDKRIKLIVEKERKGKASAINLITKKAKQGVVVQTDGDVVVSKNAISSLLEHFSDKKIGAVSGQPIPVLPKNSIFYDWAKMSYRKEHEIRLKESARGEFWHVSGYLFAHRKKAFGKIPFLKGAVDAYIGKKIYDKDYKIAYEPRAKVFVKYPTTIRDFINQKARVRAGFYFLSKKLGKAPRKMKGEIFYFFPELFKLKPSRWPAFFFSALIYTCAWLKGLYFYKTSKSLAEIWKHIETTK